MPFLFMHQGLTHAEAAQRLDTYGLNSLAIQSQNSPVRMFLRTFKSPLLILLLAASAVSMFFGDMVSAVEITLMVLLSSMLDFWNSYRSDRAAQALKDTVKIHALVVRDGEHLQIPLDHLVPGDVVVLGAGDLIPADGSILEATHLFLNESSLNGESFPSAKEPSAQVYMGSSVTSGAGLMEVTATGHATKFSHIAAAVSQQAPITEFDREMKDFSYLIIKITFVLVIFVFFVNALFKRDLFESLLFSVALAVGLTPEMLPMIITLNLTRGSLVMAKHGVIVKRLASIQNLGNMDVLCTDKTGTLTEDRIAVVRYVNGFGEVSDETLQYAYLNSVFSGGFKSPLDTAIQAYKHLSHATFSKIDELPFDFERRRSSVVLEHEHEEVIVTKGSPEELLASCTYYDPKHHRLNPATMILIQQQYLLLSQQGLRVLGVAIKHVSHQDHYATTDETKMTFLGFIAFLDPPKKTVTTTLKNMQSYGLTVKIITGDGEQVTRHVAEQIHLPVEGMLLGQDIDQLTDNQMRVKIEQTTIFARVNPEQKMRIIKLLQSNNHVVGYIGDGINDAPSLKIADVGISVNNAVDIAKESADLILLHKSLSDLTRGIIEGRKTYANTMKYLRMSLSSNFGNVFSMAAGSLFLPFLPMLPTQILLNNLLYDTSQFALPLDDVDPDAVLQPQRLKMQTFKRFMFVFGPLSSIFDMVTFFALLSIFNLSAPQFQAGWFLESLATQVFVVYIIRTRKLPFIESSPSRPLLISTLGAVGIGTLIALTHLGTYFGFKLLPLSAILAVGAIFTSYLLIMEVAKRAFYHRYAV